MRVPVHRSALSSRSNEVSTLTIRKAARADSPLLARLASNMWDADPAGLEHDFARLTISQEAACFLAYHDEEPIGFAQCQLRHDYVEGTETSPVGFLEGIWVHPDYQRQGVARQLVQACEDWARSVGCTEFASDCELDNHDKIGRASCRERV